MPDDIPADRPAQSLDVEEAASRLSMTPTSLRRFCTEGRIVSTLTVPVAEVERILAARRKEYARIGRRLDGKPRSKENS